MPSLPWSGGVRRRARAGASSQSSSTALRADSVLPSVASGGAPDQRAGMGACGLAVAERDRAVDDGCRNAVGLLRQTVCTKTSSTCAPGDTEWLVPDRRWPRSYRKNLWAPKENDVGNCHGALLDCMRPQGTWSKPRETMTVKDRRVLMSITALAMVVVVIAIASIEPALAFGLR